MGKVVSVEEALVVKYETSIEEIGKLKASFADVTFDTPANYEIGRKAIGQLRELRGKVEKRRKDLKASSLEFGRKVDAAARLLTGALEEIEDPLLAAKRVVDDEEARVKREAERAELIALEAKMREEREAAEAKAKAEREAEEARLSAERARLAAQEAAQAEQRRKLDEERRAVEEQTAQLNRAKEARLKAERAAQQAADDLRAAAELAARVAAARPDIEKLQAWGQEIRDFVNDTAPKLGQDEVASAVTWAVGRLTAVADSIATFRLRAR